jgi:ribulose kinase
MGAVVATYAGYTLREKLSDALGHDFPVAAVEDLIAFGGATMVCLAQLGGSEEATAAAAAASADSYDDALAVLGWPHS